MSQAGEAPLARRPAPVYPYRHPFALMSMPPLRGQVTDLLLAWSQGDEDAAERIIPLVYDELRARAAAVLRPERPDHTLTPNALVHEAYLRLVDQRLPRFESRKHFYGVAARVMRQVLVDHARSRKAAKRNAGRQALPLDENFPVTDERAADLMALDDALAALAGVDPEKAKLVELRYFTGLTIEDTAEMLGVSPATVKREWAMARAWLHREISGAP
jgi:RNA polymerase sigma factor (TIGR02999 family)